MERSEQVSQKGLSLDKLLWMEEGPPLLAVCGKKNSGKTTYLEQVVKRLSQAGVKVAMIKHDGHEFSGDVPGTDSFRLYEAGAFGTAVFSEKQVLIHKRSRTTLPEVIKSFSEADLILVEGMKELPVQKLEIIREGIGQAPCSNPEGRLGIVTDSQEVLKNCREAMVLDLNRPQDLAAMLLACVKERRLPAGVFPQPEENDMQQKKSIIQEGGRSMGKIIAVCTSPRKGTQKTNVHEAELIQEYGLKGDAHAGKWHRQVSLLSYEQFEEFKKKGASIEYGAFGENLLVEGFDFKSFPVGTRFKCKDVILEITQIGKECHHGCTIRQTMGDCIMPREGVFARVLQGGTIREGDEMALMPKFTHFDEEGNAFMVDVGEKTDTDRVAVAAGIITMSRECFGMVKEGSMKKGDVLGVSRIAGIMAAKKTGELIPLCHMLQLSQVEIQFELQEATCSIEAKCTAKTVDKTGVEMEALTGVNVALLTIYDMCKAVDRGMHMDQIRLLSKSGGKSGLWEAAECRTNTEES